MKLDLGKIFFLILFLTLSVMAATAGTVKGTITDRQTKEPLTGATIQIAETRQGVIADLDGHYSIDVKPGNYTLLIRYVGYKDIRMDNIQAGNTEIVLNFEMESDAQTLGEVSVIAKKNLEGERALQMERQKATLAIENLGSKEMSIKGIGNVTGLSTGVDKLFVFGIIVSVGMSLGGLTGYAINPARDLGPRLAHAVLPIKGKGDSNFSYGLVVPIVGPIIGAIVAVLLYGAIPW